MTVGGHGRQTLNKGIHAPISWTFADAAARLAFTPTEGNPLLEAQLTSADLYKLAVQLSDESFWALTALGPTTWAAFGGVGIHALGGASHTASTLAALNALVSDATLHDSGTGGAVHANATTSVAGFMSGADKTKLDGVAASAAALTATSPVDVTKAAAVVGVGTTAARYDHKHDVSTAAAVGLTDSTNAEGAATSLARSDHTHGHGSRGGGSLHAQVTTSVDGFMIAADKTKLDGIAAAAAALTATAPVDVTKAAAAVGVGTTAARHDHKHDVSTAAPGATGVGTASAEGSSTSLARADHAHQSNTAPVDVTKAAAAIGTSGQPARADHKHDISTAAPASGAVAVGNSASEGTATSLARSDHQHTVTAGTPVTINTANAAGSATTFARSDHVHAHGDHAGGTLHAVATTSVAGFLSGADKTKLDALATFQTYTYYADQFDNPNTADWAVNAFAEASPDTNNSALTVRLFDDTTVEGVGLLVTIPSTATNIIFDFKSRADTTPGGTVAAVPGLYRRSLPDNSALSSWSAITSLTALSFTTNELWQYDTQTIALSTLSMTAGLLYQLELVRNTASGSDTLAGDWALIEFRVRFS